MSKSKKKSKVIKKIVVIEKKCDCGWCHTCLIAYRRIKSIEILGGKILDNAIFHQTYKSN